MNNRMISQGVVGGRVSQAGIVPADDPTGPLRTSGLILTAAVVATYTTDQEAFPSGFDPEPVAVFCDVIVYSTGLLRGAVLRRAMVAGFGFHSGHVWKPRAAKQSLNGSEFSLETTDPRAMDGDHVLVQFLDDNLSRPVITGRIPHPRMSVGDDSRDVGNRMRLKLADGSPDFIKNQGSFLGIDKSGNMVFNGTRANDGSINETGAEIPSSAPGFGGARITLSESDSLLVRGVDADGTSAPAFSLALDRTALVVRLQDGSTLRVENKDGNAALTLGDGAKHVAIVEALQQLYESLKAQLDTLKTAYESHTHSVPAAGLAGTIGVPPAVGIAGAATAAPPAPSGATFPSWDNTINSTKVSIPNG